MFHLTLACQEDKYTSGREFPVNLADLHGKATYTSVARVRLISLDSLSHFILDFATGLSSKIAGLNGLGTGLELHPPALVGGKLQLMLWLNTMTRLCKPFTHVNSMLHVPLPNRTHVILSYTGS